MSKTKTMRTAIALIVILVAVSVTAQQPDGRKLFEAKCAKCHGKDGLRGRFGAANLKISRLDDVQLFRVISKGKNWMPAWERKLAPEQIRSVITYIKTLRNQ